LEKGVYQRWRALRAQHIAKNPFCLMCKKDLGAITQAKHVDHVVPHRGSLSLLLDEMNLQSLCEKHHNSSKQREEKRGVSSACDINGYPVDPNHPWNRGGVKSG
jgi:5-methylcytosine-specific restriction enzyme A